MNLQSVFQAPHPLCIPFIMAGHPNPDMSVDALMALQEAGADIIEWGIPFSDPMADGVIIQRAAEQALQHDMNLDKALTLLEYARAKGFHVPVMLFSYLNPLLVNNTWIDKAKSLGVQGLLVVDLPPEEKGMGKRFKRLDRVLLASPTTDSARWALYEHINPAFIYYISRLGVTGVQGNLAVDLEQGIRRVREALPGQKMAVGFGISTPDQAAKAAMFADAVVVGSALVQALEQQGLMGFKALAKELVLAIHKSRNPVAPDLS